MPLAYVTSQPGTVYSMASHASAPSPSCSAGEREPNMQNKLFPTFDLSKFSHSLLASTGSRSTEPLVTREHDRACAKSPF